MNVPSRHYINLKNAFCLLMAAMICDIALLGAAETDDSDARLLERSTRDYWNGVYPPEIPRAFDVHRDGCPVCGDGIKKHGMYSWIIDPSRPFKVKCPECGTVFPDNDFEAYWKSGFKDKSLLTGKYVDDGRGWRPSKDKPKYWFVAYYNHWNMYQDTKTDGTDAFRLSEEELGKFRERIGYASQLLPSYGFASLQNGNRSTPTAVVLAFPSYFAHRHSDTMHIDLFTENAPLAPD